VDEDSTVERALVVGEKRFPFAAAFGPARTVGWPSELLDLLPLLERSHCWFGDLDRDVPRSTADVLWKLFVDRAHELHDAGATPHSVDTATTATEVHDLVAVMLRHGTRPILRRNRLRTFLARVARFIIGLDTAGRTRRVLTGPPLPLKSVALAMIFHVLLALAKRNTGVNRWFVASVHAENGGVFNGPHAWNWVVSLDHDHVVVSDRFVAALAVGVDPVPDWWNPDIVVTHHRNLSALLADLLLGYAGDGILRDRSEIVTFVHSLFASIRDDDDVAQLLDLTASHETLHPDVAARVAATVGRKPTIVEPSVAPPRGPRFRQMFLAPDLQLTLLKPALARLGAMN
jgi:hypothetical protein